MGEFGQVGGGRPADDDPEVTRVRQPGPPDSPTPPQQGTPYAQPPYGGPVGAQPPAPNPYAPAGQARVLGGGFIKSAVPLMARPTAGLREALAG